jgi:hypothetical protein
MRHAAWFNADFRQRQAAKSILAADSTSDRNDNATSLRIPQQRDPPTTQGPIKTQHPAGPAKSPNPDAPRVHAPRQEAQRAANPSEGVDVLAEAFSRGRRGFPALEQASGKGMEGAPTLEQAPLSPTTPL